VDRISGSESNGGVEMTGETCRYTFGYSQETMKRFEWTQNPEDKQLLATYVLAAKVDAKNPSTAFHSQNVARYASAMAEALNYSEADIKTLYTAGVLHDIGKIGIPDSILLKQDTLTQEEWIIIKTPPQCGYSFLKPMKALENILDLVYSHHERYDGEGYPRGLKGEQIPTLARILSVADSFEAMTANRAYRQRTTPYQALQELKRCSGSQFDPEIVVIFEGLLRRSFDFKNIPLLEDQVQDVTLTPVS
jgi:putative two-component system response regulator